MRMVRIKCKIMGSSFFVLRNQLYRNKVLTVARCAVLACNIPLVFLIVLP